MPWFTESAPSIPRRRVEQLVQRAVEEAKNRICKAPKRVLLVSCALESLARDLAALAPGFRVTALRLCDLFPHTEHVEAVTLLERRA